MAKLKIAKNKIDEIVELYEMGASKQIISRKLGISEKQVLESIKKYCPDGKRGSWREEYAIEWEYWTSAIKGGGT